MATVDRWQPLDAVVARIFREQAALLRQQAGDDRARADILTAAADKLDRAVRTGARERWHLTPLSGPALPARLDRCRNH